LWLGKPLVRENCKNNQEEKKMKKLLTLLFSVLLVASLVGCGEKKVEENVLKIGATPVPHAEILELIKDDLAADGVKLEIVEFTDYVKPNLALDTGEIDANFFQHIPYMVNFGEENGLELVNVGSVHVEPMGLYSDKIKDISELKEGDIIGIPNDPVNGGRALLLLQEYGIIKIDETAGFTATEKDITENPMGIKIKAVEAAQLPRVLADVTGAVINGNYAIESGLNPLNDSIIIENANSPYVNIVTTIKGKEDDPRFVTLFKHLNSDKVKNHIIDSYNGGVVPAFEN
jgi:D-methionine transport system substrate-binding protein